MLKTKWRITGLLAVLVLALVLVPAVAMAAAPITQGVQGTVKDATTGVGIPFAHALFQVDGGAWVDIDCEYDGTYSYGTPVSDDIRVDAYAPNRVTGSAYPDVQVGAVTTQDFLLERGDIFSQPIYRFFNMRGGVHFYTASDEEFINVHKNLSDVFHYDGIAYVVPWGESENPDYTNPNTFPLYRFFNRNTGVHFYTMSEAEKANVMATRGDDYIYEGIAYWVSETNVFAEPAQTSGEGFPVYRFYVPSRDAHFFTADSGEVFGGPFSQLSNYYHYEGVGFYINGWVYDPVGNGG